MLLRKSRPRAVLTVGLLALLSLPMTLSALAQAPQDRQGLREPVYRVENETAGAGRGEIRTADASNPASRENPIHVLAAQNARPNEHPLMPAIRIAKMGLEEIDANVEDYSCTMVKRERIDGVLGNYEYMFMKVRHKPFSVYLYFLAPNDIKGRECIYVEGSQLIAHEGGVKGRFLPTVTLDPGGALATRGQRYPITEIGIRNLTARLVEVATADSKYGECDVKFFKGSKVNGRTCTGIQVVHPVPRDNFTFHIAQVFIDDELRMPIRYASYGWPQREGEKPPLMEEYTYLNLKINNGFTDADFDRTNKDYNF